MLKRKLESEVAFLVPPTWSRQEDVLIWWWGWAICEQIPKEGRTLDWWDDRGSEEDLLSLPRFWALPAAFLSDSICLNHLQVNWLNAICEPTVSRTLVMASLKQPAGLLHFLPHSGHSSVYPPLNYHGLTAFVVFGLYCGQCLRKCELKHLICWRCLLGF